MKDFIRIFCAFFIFSSLVFVGCSDPDEEEMTTLNAHINANANEKADNANNAAVTKFYTADLTALNGSGVYDASASLKLEGNELTVTIKAKGLEPNALHPQHIHGFTTDRRNSTCPTASADNNDDGFVSVGEGAPFYGPVLLPLIMDLSNPVSFPTANEDGEIDFVKTYTVDTSITPLQNRAIVLHGLTVEGFVTNKGETIDGYRLTLPVACGQIVPAQGSTGNGS